MPINANLIGRSTEPMVHEVDARWTMAYSAGLGDFDDCYMDTTREDGVVAHPLFAICPEWPVVLDARDLLLAAGMTEAESLRGVHASHDVYVHRLVRPGDRLYTQASILSVDARKPGSYLVMRLDTNDEMGQPVCTTFQGSLYRDVEVVGEPVSEPQGHPEPPSAISSASEPTHHVERAVDANAAHVYTECARIWNPIHTDLAVAKAAGLPGLIYHGSATLALAVSAVVEQLGEGEPELVTRIACAFRGMVLMPSDLDIRMYAVAPAPGDPRRTVRFEVLKVDGRPAIADGLVELVPPDDAL